MRNVVSAYVLDFKFFFSVTGPAEFSFSLQLRDGSQGTTVRWRWIWSLFPNTHTRCKSCCTLASGGIHLIFSYPLWCNSLFIPLFTGYCCCIGLDGDWLWIIMFRICVTAPICSPVCPSIFHHKLSFLLFFLCDFDGQFKFTALCLMLGRISLW